MSKYFQNVSGSIEENISKLTGIKREVLNSKVKEVGLNHLMSNPHLVLKDVTKIQMDKFNTLKDTVTMWKEICFLREDTQLDSSQKAKEYFRRRLEDKQDKEYFEVAFLNANNTITHVETLFEGSLTETAVYPREVIKRCLEVNADRIVLAHNHPAGTLRPSNADRKVTEKLKTACDSMNIGLIDHIIVTSEDAISFAEKGYL